MCALPSKKNWVPPHDAVLKLRIGDTEIRRINAAGFVKDDTIFYKVLVKKAIRFSGFEVVGDSSLKDFDVKTTYVDEDGDVITFTSNSEFSDAWKNNTEKVFRVSVTVQKKNVDVPEDTKVDTPEETLQEELVENETAPARVGRRCGKGRPGGKGRPMMAIRGRLNKLETQMEQIIQGMKKNPDLEKIICTMEETKEDAEDVCAPTAEDSDNLGGVTEDVVCEILENASKSPEDLREVHYGVQCDGCPMNPIVGTRFRATNMANYDLCDACHKVMNLPDVQFEAMGRPSYKKGVLCPAKFGKDKHECAANNNFDEAKEVQGKVDGQSNVSIPQATKVSSSELKEKHYGIACDACVMNPIVGDRFRAINMTDYDLCEKCHSESKLLDVKFEKILSPFFKNATHLKIEKLVLNSEESKVEVNDILSSEKKKDVESKIKIEDVSVAKSINSAEGNDKVDVHSSELKPAVDIAERKDAEVNHNTDSQIDKNLLKDEKKLSMAPDSRPEIHHRFSCDGCLMRPIVGPRYRAKNGMDFDLCETCYIEKKIPDVEFERVLRNVTASCSSMQSNSAKDPLERSLEFIHGRHTCDGCMITPIVGLRYHALNLPDYDLCADCFNKYDGNEIIFETAELDRDRNRQPMWKVKASRGVVKSFEERRNKASRYVNERKVSPAPALSTSLEEDNKKENEITEALGQALDESAKVIGTFVKELTDAVEKQADNTCLSALTESEESKAFVQQREIDVVPTLAGDAVDDTLGKTPAPDDLSALPCDINEDHSVKGLSEVSSLPSLDLTGKYFKHDSVVDEDGEVPDNFVTMSSAQSYDESADRNLFANVEKDSKNDSVVEVNEEYGDALDNFANESFDESADKSVFENVELKDCDSSSDDVGLVIAGDDGESTTVCSKKSHNVVDGNSDQVEDIDEKSHTTDDEWDVLDDVAQQIESDAALARAASLVGSALFEDSQKDSHTLPRWSTELKQLHELGFLDDHRSIDILDSLNAANIGSGETAPIKIEKVVERLLKNH